MNRKKSESIAHKVRARILKDGGDRLWSFHEFVKRDPEAASAIAAALSRLSRNGDLHRVRRGVYYRPRKTAFGESRPDATAVAKIVLGKRPAVRTREFNRLGLTTQMGGALTSATIGPTRLEPVKEFRCVS